MNTKSIFLLSFFLLTTPKLIFADGSSHTEEQPVPSPIEEITSFNDSIYSIGVDEDTEPPSIDESPLDSPFSNINSLGIDAPLVDNMITSEPMKRFKEKTNSADQHDQHKKQHVEESLHEWVSPTVKGHKVAIAITVISGLAFLGLSFFRIGEKR
jgi:hypothetical protein